MNEQPTCIVVGGTSGLGLELAKRATMIGLTPVVCGRTVDSLRDQPGLENAQFVTLDLTSLTIPASLRIEETPADYFIWAAGIFQQLPFQRADHSAIKKMVKTHIAGPLELLHGFHAHQLRIGRPYHLVTIGSTSSYRLRRQEALYAASTAFKAAYTRQIASEIIEGLPGSKVTLIQPAGMKTGLWGGTDRTMDGYMDPVVVADQIWKLLKSQGVPFAEFYVDRTENGEPVIRHDVRRPETYQVGGNGN